MVVFLKRRETAELPRNLDELCLNRNSVGYGMTQGISTVCCSKLLSSTEHLCIAMHIAETALDSSVR